MLTESALRQAIDIFELTEHANRLEDRDRDGSLGLLVMVIGAGNFGKSSLINALCGKSVAPVAVIPKTFKIDVFTVGQNDLAYVRYTTEDRPRELDHETARLIEAEVEKEFRAGSTTQLAEIIWEHEGLNLPREISLVDTPGIAQALGKATKGISLTSVLGSTFEVDQVWAKWFHRADLVIWAFSANKMEDADTRIALEAALNLFDKPVIPVATKADLIPQDRWSEIHSRFNSIYGPLLKDRQAGELVLTVAAGKNPELNGTGIPELRTALTEIASEALLLKNHANTAFIRDETAAVAQVLDETAKILVANLRTISSLGDSLAEEAGREALRGRVEATHRINSYLRELARDPRLFAVAESIHEQTKGGRQGSAELEARTQLLNLLDQDLIEKEITRSFSACARSLETTSIRFTQGAEISRLTFKSSGQIERAEVPLTLSLRALALTSRLEFQIKLENPTGWLGRTWDAIRRLFGLDRFSVADIHQAMTSALSIQEGDIEDSMQQALLSGFAPALFDAVDGALVKHLESSDAQALALLKEVDRLLPELVQSNTRNFSTTYAPQAEYWSTLNPSVKTLLNLARSEITGAVPSFQDLLRAPFPYEYPTGFPPFQSIWKRRTIANDVISVEIEMRDLLRKTKLVIREQNDLETESLENSFDKYIVDTQQGALITSPLLANLDDHLQKAVSVARYQSAGSRMANLGSLSFQKAISQSPRRWVCRQAYDRVGKVVASKGTLLGTGLLVGGGALCFFINRWVGGGLWVTSVVWFIVGLQRPYLVASNRYKSEILNALIAEIQESQKDSAESISPSIVDQVLQGMAAELAPRPLQKLLIDAELLNL